ncbi:hypothetical protein FXW78_49770 [Rhodococcus opacus]|nr:hypothetical protein [Rhodococcus opacus]
MAHFRYVGTHERIHLDPAARMINYGDIVAAPSNPDPRYFELVEPDLITERNGTEGRRSMGAPEPE